MQINIQKISHSIIEQSGVELYIARVDKVHPLASGNKYYKLKPNLEYAKKHGFKRLLSFGGAYSNYIHAFALYAAKKGFKTVGVIRGEPEYATNPTLQDVQEAGMELKFVNREEYRLRNDDAYLSQLQQEFPDTLIIPEGGSSQIAVASCKSLMCDINKIQKCDIIAAASGTGATFAGLVCGLGGNQTAISYAALKDETLLDRIKVFISDEGLSNYKYRIESASFGGFAKLDKSILDFILDWLDQTGILLDPIYTGKMGFRLIQQIKSGEFSKGTSICMVHSGGLQGWRGMKGRVIKISSVKSWAIINEKLKSL